MKLLKFFILIVVGIFIFVPETVQAQQSYVVRSYIVVPPKLRGPQSTAKIESYKPLIMDATKQVQEMFKKLLNGKTFQMHAEVQAIDGLIAPSLPPPPGTPPIDELLFFDKTVKNHPPGFVHIYWILGTSGGPRYGGSLERSLDKGRALMRHEDLLNLAGSDQNKKKDTLYTLAHELGHAFGGVYAGYAKGHSCSSVSKDECEANAPRPLPSSDEWESIMGYAAPYQLFPNLKFNNSIHNPEIVALYRSPFINPHKNPAPTPISRPYTPNSSYFSLKGDLKIRVGEVLTIPSKDFAPRKGNEEFYFIDALIKNPSPLSTNSYSIISWDNQFIRIQINENAVLPTAKDSRYLKIVDSAGDIWYSTDIVTIMGKNYEDKPRKWVNVEAQITCGADKSPLEGITVLVKQVGKESFLFGGSTFEDGKIDFIFSNESSNLSEVDANSEYYFAPAVFDNQTAEPARSENFNFNFPEDFKDFKSQFHYNNCPATKTIPASSQVLKTIISNYEDFRLENTPDDIGSKTLTVDSPRQDQTINWQLSTGSNNVYIREVYSEESIRDYKVQLVPNSQTKVGMITIKSVQSQKSVSKVILNGQEINRNNLDSSINIKLAETNFHLPIEVHYTDGTIRFLAINFQDENPSLECPDNKIYCDNATDRKIHQHGGVVRGGECVYAFDDIGACQDSNPASSIPQEKSGCAHGFCATTITSLSSSNGKIDVSWVPASGENPPFYAIRFGTHQHDPRLAPNGVVNDEYRQTSYSKECNNGQLYWFWVHSMKDKGLFGGGSKVSITCQGASTPQQGDTCQYPEDCGLRGVHTCTGTIHSDGICKYTMNVSPNCSACNEGAKTPAGSACNYSQSCNNGAGTQTCSGSVQSSTCKYDPAIPPNCSSCAAPSSAGLTRCQYSQGCNGSGTQACNGAMDNGVCRYNQNITPSCSTCSVGSGPQEGSSCTYPEDCYKNDGSGGAHTCRGTIQGGQCKYNPAVDPACSTCQ